MAEWCLETESNRRHKDFQSFALPTELSRLLFLVADVKSVDLLAKLALQINNLSIT
jgi:hypothetical protein